MTKAKKSDATKIFVIVENSFEYNDEYYYRNGDGGNPKIYYTSEKEAMERCQQLNEFARASACKEDYSDGYSDDFDINEVVFYDVYPVLIGE
jgi:hypothetical protein